MVQLQIGMQCVRNRKLTNISTVSHRENRFFHSNGKRSETFHILETPEREQNSTSESSEDPDRILVEKVIIPVSDTTKQDPV